MEIVLIGLVVLSAYYDIRLQIIPNALVLPAILFFWAAHGVWGGWPDFSSAAMGTGLAFLLFLLPYAIGVIGAGDVKLFMAVGACLGPNYTITAFLLTALAGGIYALFVLLTHKGALLNFLRKTRDWILVSIGLRRFALFPEEEQPMPMLCYGVAIAGGTVATLLLSYYFPNLAIVNLQKVVL
ncbi:A24 family peptidase [Halodesulfovibrio marinisediminis]|uniref:Prepilin peptidase CpaA n=1 Tax=Halodesulfovibrio marinisediminis DSM 17456 TaxID=1121457 RepID=A0A1N6EAJ7_9BACT|nr:A24 family peptidase [Halodesulfovibrio marinisediminis]SIN80023.1 prepilin peptidase CpaA [Halodesulfovibrio marinisediminis DSM 17456]